MKNKGDKLRNGLSNTKDSLYKLVLLVLTVFCGFILYRSVFEINSPGNTVLNIYGALSYSPADLKPIVLIIGSIIYIGGLYKLYQVFSKKHFTDRRVMLYGSILVVLFFVALCIYTYYCTISPSYDLIHIRQEAYAMVTGRDELRDVKYYNRYPNNIAITLIMAAVYKVAQVLGVHNYSLAGNVFGSLMIAMTAWICFCTVKKCRNKESALLVLVIFVTNPLFYLYASYYYSDIICMPIAMLMIYLFVSSCKENRKPLWYATLALCGFVGMIGYKVRATLIILLVAIVVWTFFKKNIRQTVLTALILIVGMIPGLLVMNTVYQKADVTSDKNTEFPITHWLMMGLNETSGGKYSQDDFKYTSSLTTYEEKVDGNLAQIKERLSEQGISGTIDHAKEKLAIVWSDGFGVPNLFAEQENYGKAYEYSIGSKSIFLRYYAQICRSSMFFLLVLVLVASLRKKKPDISFFFISFFGAILFYLLWEANERYSLSFLPWLLVLLADGIVELRKASKIKGIQFITEDQRVHVWNKDAKARGFAIVLLFVSVTMMVSNVRTYTGAPKEVQETVASIPSISKCTEMLTVGNNEIEQTMRAEKAFNQIQLRVDDAKVSSTTSYTMSIYDGKKKVREAAFTSDEVNGTMWLTLSFDTITPKDETVYTIRITSKDASEENSIRMQSNWYINSQSSTLLVDGKKLENRLNMKLGRTYTRTYSSMRVYAGVCAAILITELVLLYPLFTVRKKEEELGEVKKEKRRIA